MFSISWSYYVHIRIQEMVVQNIIWLHNTLTCLGLNDIQLGKLEAVRSRLHHLKYE